jgi:hypothetical protein
MLFYCAPGVPGGLARSLVGPPDGRGSRNDESIKNTMATFGGSANLLRRMREVKNRMITG